MESESGSNPNPNWIYDVYLSFLGEANPASFVSHLCTALANAGVSVCRDGDELSRGNLIPHSVLSAIEASRISIMVFSKHYASSTWCLDELVKIMECFRTIGQRVLPVFYDVQPSDVRRQKGMFGEAFEALIQRVSVEDDKLITWRASLTDASNLSGYALTRSRNESEDIKDVVARVAHLLDYTVNLVGVKSRVQELIQLLKYPQLEYTQLLGIYGMRGIGKTTIARALYDQIGHKFEGRCFLDNINERTAKQNDQVSLQQRLLFAIYPTTNIKIDTIELGKLILKERLSGKRIFLVLDDVGESNQIEALCGSREWFGLGSIIIITTRDENVLSMSGVDFVYKVKRLDENESLELFSWDAFQQASPREDFIQISREAVGYCAGQPVALKALGGYLNERDISEWKSLLQRLKTKPDDHPVRDVLKISFDGLTDEEKKIFLDIACFFVGMDTNFVIHKLSTSTLSPEIGIGILYDKSLVAIDENNKLQMHSLVRDLGKEIVREDSRMRPEPKIYDVFLSFRGKDTRASFTSHLYTCLQNAGIYTFKDDDEIQRGDQISLSLPQAIRRSRIAIVVLSQCYANSRWCLQELENIMECRRTMGLVVVPVFYGVDPSEVRHKTGKFGASFKNLTSEISVDGYDVQNWEIALLEIVGLAGFVILNTRNESEDIKNIVEHVTRLLDRTDLFVADHPVGVKHRVHDIIQLLKCEKSNDVLLLGIWGMGGMGKTTIAKAIYNEIRHNFEAKSFLLNVRDAWAQDNGQICLQERLLYDIYKTTKMKIDTIESGKITLKERLRQKKIFLVLDDVNKLDQLSALCASREWFGKGSRIIITTRDEDLLCKLEVDHVYRMKEMDKNESLELFSWHAFKQASPNKGFADLSTDVVEYCGGLPLALQVIGSYLLKRGKREWKSVLEKLKVIPNGEVLEKLRISFDGLSDDKVKEIFLDIAFFFIGMDRDDVIDILNVCGLFPVIGISVLVQQSLVIVDNKNKLRMHDLLRDMGREIVREKAPEVTEERSRLWLYEDFVDVLSKDTRTTAIKGVVLKLPTSNTTHLETKAFEKMNRLKLLQLTGIHLDGEYKYLSRDLRWLCWHGFPLKCTPKDFYQGGLVAIELKYSNLERVWKKSRVYSNLFSFF